MAAVVIAAVVELVDIPALVRLYRVWTGRLGGIYGWAARADFLAALAALLGVLVFDTLPGLFFANADHVRGTILARVSPATVAVVLDAETTPFIDVSATEMLARLAQDLRRQGVELLVAHGIGQMRDVLRRAGGQESVLQTIYPTVDEAIAALPTIRQGRRKAGQGRDEPAPSRGRSDVPAGRLTGLVCEGASHVFWQQSRRA